MPRLKVYDTLAALEIVEARVVLLDLRDDFRAMVRRAKLAKQTAAYAMAHYKAGVQAELEGIEGDGMSQPDLRVEDADDEFRIYTYDVIDDQAGISATQFADALNQAGGKRVVNYINSPGGYVDEARAIHTQLARYAREVPDSYSVVDSMAASAATTIALGLPRVEMAYGTTFMVHRAWGKFQASVEDVEAIREDLDRVDRQIAGDYVRKTGMSEDEVLALMSAETVMTENEALARGLADAIHGEEDPERQPANKLDGTTGYTNAARAAALAGAY